MQETPHCTHVETQGPGVHTLQTWIQARDYWDKVGAVSTSCAVEFHWKIICVFVPMSRKEMIKYNQLVQTQQSAGK